MPELNPQIFIDVETTTHNTGHPFDARNKLVSFVCNDSFKYFTDPDFSFRPSPGQEVIGFNVKFDLHWTQPDLTGVKIWDCQLAEFVYSGQEDRLISLDECLERYGLPKKKSHLVEDYWKAGVQTDQIPLPYLKEYNEGDVSPLKLLYKIQQSLLNDKQKNLVYLLGEDMKVLMEMERNGILFNKEEATTKIADIKKETENIEAALCQYLPEIKNAKFNWDSGDQLSALLYGGTITYDYFISSEEVYKSGNKKGQTYTRNRWFEEVVSFPQRFKPLPRTEVKKTLDNAPNENHFYQVDEPTLKQLRARDKQTKRLLELLMLRSAQIKVMEMLQSILDQFVKKHWEGSYIHPQYNQNIVITGRLSSSGPNMQNQPPEVDKYLVSRYD